MTRKTNRPAAERRAAPHAEFRIIRAEGADPVISGHAALFNSLSEEMFGFREQIAPGAFTETLKTADVRALWNHDPNHILGRSTAGTLRLVEDSRGLAIEIDPPDTQTARDLMLSMERGDVTQMSFGFRTIEDRWETKDGADLRTLVKVELFDVSPVAFPAYPDTDVAVRAHDSWRAALAPPPRPNLLRARQRLAEIDA